MAELFLATAPGEHGFERKVVIKRLLPHLAREPVYTAMFIDEAKLTAQLSHPKIAQTYELGRVDDSLFIAMEFIDGIDVLGLLREHAWQRKRPPLELSVWICHEILDALDFAHNLRDETGAPLGVVHRDISPSNLLLSRRGDVKLVDFGIARASGSGRHHRTKSGTLKGKYGYMSPEQVLEQSVDARSDLFSIGVVLAEMLCGRRLFAAAAELDVLLMVRDAKLTRLDQFGGHVPPSLDAILRRALRKDPAERWQSAADLRDALADWMFQERVRVTPRHIGELVESIHEQVWQRKRETMAQSDAENAALAAAAPSTLGPNLVPAPRPSRRAPSEGGGARLDAKALLADTGALAAMDGIPRGELKLTDSLPIISIEAEDDLPEPTDASQGPLALGSDGSIDLDLAFETAGAPHDLDDFGLGPAGSRPHHPAGSRPHRTGDAHDAHGAHHDDGDSGKVSIATQAAVSAAGFLDTDFGDLANEIEAAVMHLQVPAPTGVIEVEASVRYASIEDAIAAVSPTSADPSAIDFDETEIEPRASRSDSIRLPTPDEIVARAVQAEPPTGDEIVTPCTDEGDFTNVAPISVLFRLAATQSTGLLVASVGGIKKEIFIRAGIPEFVSSNVASELLGAYLVQCGALSSGELAMALAMMPHYGGKLGDTLVGLGLLKPLEVFRHLTVQVRQKLIDVCTWTKGTYGWYAGRQIERNAFPLDLNPFEVLGAGAMAMRDDLVVTWMSRHAADSLVQRQARPAVAPERFEIVGMAPLFERIDGTHTVGELVTESLDPATQRRTARMLILMLQTGLVVVEEL
ncbi:MAG: serine/threonine protein kinase [Myxococcales bacterium]|nr:serine/threonine protein kinase [Myxococcales bacterium]